MMALVCQVLLMEVPMIKGNLILHGLPNAFLTCAIFITYSCML